MYGNKPVEPTSRGEAYFMLAHLAQSMSNEVKYSEQVAEKNRELVRKNKDLEAKLAEREKYYERFIEQKNQTIDSIRQLKNDYYNMYLELLQKYEPEKYCELMNNDNCGY